MTKSHARVKSGGRLQGAAHDKRLTRCPMLIMNFNAAHDKATSGERAFFNIAAIK